MSYLSQKTETKEAIRAIKKARSEIRRLEPQILNTMSSDKKLIAKSAEWKGKRGDDFRDMVADLISHDKTYYTTGYDIFKICLVNALHKYENRLDYLQRMIDKLSDD